MYHILLINFKHIHTLHMVKSVSCIHVNCWMYDCMCLYQVAAIVPTHTYESIPPSVMELILSHRWGEGRERLNHLPGYSRSMGGAWATELPVPLCCWPAAPLPGRGMWQPAGFLCVQAESRCTCFPLPSPSWSPFGSVSPLAPVLTVLVGGWRSGLCKQTGHLLAIVWPSTVSRALSFLCSGPPLCSEHGLMWRAS